MPLDSLLLTILSRGCPALEIFCLHATFQNDAQRCGPSILRTMTVSLFEKWSKLSPRSRAMVQTQVLSAFYDTHAKGHPTKRFGCRQYQCFVSPAGTIDCGQASSSYGEMAALVSAVMTCLSK